MEKKLAMTSHGARRRMGRKGALGACVIYQTRLWRHSICKRYKSSAGV